MLTRLELHARARGVAGLSMKAVAKLLGVSEKAIYDRLAAGDPPMEGLTPPMVAARAGHELLTLARIAEATGCPIKALDPVAPLVPVWVLPGAEAGAEREGSDANGGGGEVPPAVLAELRDLLALPPDADARAVAEAVGARVDAQADLESRTRTAEGVAVRSKIRFEPGAPTSKPAPLPAPDPSRPARERGLEARFRVERVDGRDLPGGDRDGADYLVLDLKHDPLAVAAAMVYGIEADAEGYHQLASDIRSRIRRYQPDRFDKTEVAIVSPRGAKLTVRDAR